MMNCKIAQQQMALAVGDDLAPAEMSQLRHHLNDCHDCQGLWKTHQHTFALVQRSRDTDCLERRSVWPAVAKQIKRRSTMERLGDFNGWIAGLAVAAAVVLVFVFSQNGEPPRVTENGPTKQRVLRSRMLVDFDGKNEPVRRESQKVSPRILTPEEFEALRERLRREGF